VYQLGKLIASLPPSGWTQANLIAPLAKLGWDSLGHPPIAYLGDEWQYRSADGSYNVALLLFDFVLIVEHSIPAYRQV